MVNTSGSVLVSTTFVAGGSALLPEHPRETDAIASNNKEQPMRALRGPRFFSLLSFFIPRTLFCCVAFRDGRANSRRWDARNARNKY
jgi:hypothetical protein